MNSRKMELEGLSMDEGKLIRDRINDAIKKSTEELGYAEPRSHGLRISGY